MEIQIKSFLKASLPEWMANASFNKTNFRKRTFQFLTSWDLHLNFFLRMPLSSSPHLRFSSLLPRLLRCRALDTPDLWSPFSLQIVRNAVVHSCFASYCAYQFSGLWLQINFLSFHSTEWKLGHSLSVTFGTTWIDDNALLDVNKLWMYC